MIFDILKELGYDLGTTLQNYYQYINTWNLWWGGYVPNFHKYQVTDINKELMQVERHKMKMAKKVSEDWANLLLNDKTLINIEDEQSQVFLSGDKNEQNGGVLGLSKFWKNGNKTVEKEYALGTAAFYLKLQNPKYGNGKLIADGVKICYIKDASQIIPLSWEDGEISECAVYSKITRKGKKYIYLQIFSVVDNGYKVENLYYINTDGESYKKTENLDGVAQWYILPAKPFFVLTPNIENNLCDVPLGLSIYANAIDQLEGCDAAYDNLYNDIILGRKKVFLSQDIIATSKTPVLDSEGKPKLDNNGMPLMEQRPLAGETIEQSMFVSIGTKQAGEAPLYEEYNPSLRVVENKENIQLNLNLLSSKVGFGQNKYRFDVQTMNTATEVKASGKDLTESVWKQRIVINDILVEMTKSILIIGKEICSQNVDPKSKITIKFDDTMFSDEEAERMRDLQEVRDQIMQAWEYRVKWYGESEEEAKAMLKSSQNMGITYGDES